MYCNQCGRQIPDGSRFCNFCGANLIGVKYVSDFDIRDGILIKYNGQEQNVVVPAGVVEVEKDAFAERFLESITIPEGCKKVYIHACARTIQLPSTIEEFFLDSNWTDSKYEVPTERLIFPLGTKIVRGRIVGAYKRSTGEISVRIPKTVTDIWINYILDINTKLRLETTGSISEYHKNVKGAIWRYQRKCQYCGGDFVKVLFSNSHRCCICRKEKDYKDSGIYIK